MAEEQVRDVIGTIDQISQVKPKEITAKKDGKKYTTFNIGIKFQDGSWHNISEFEEDKLVDKMKNSITDQNFAIGDHVKIYETSKDGKYWNVKAIVMMEPESAPTPVKEAPKVEEIDLSGVGDTKAIPETEEIKAEVVPKKDMAKVSDYKIAEANKYSLGMALNNAATILSGNWVDLSGKNLNSVIDEFYPLLVNKLYDFNVKIRKEKLGY